MIIKSAQTYILFIQTMIFWMMSTIVLMCTFILSKGKGQDKNEI